LQIHTDNSSHFLNSQNIKMTKILPLLIDNREVNTSVKFPVTSPGSGEVLWESSSASKQDAIAAVEAAARAFPSWSATKPAIRRKILLDAADLVDKRKEELKSIMRQETGSLVPMEEFNISNTAEQLRDTASRITTALVGSMPVAGDDATTALVLKEPFGVVLGIAPWYHCHPTCIVDTV
jgi:acyl-CoA reductase-like NAD-dependent aldehyde dehydrogenase